MLELGLRLTLDYGCGIISPSRWNYIVRGPTSGSVRVRSVRGRAGSCVGGESG